VIQQIPAWRQAAGVAGTAVLVQQAVNEDRYYTWLVARHYEQEGARVISRLHHLTNDDQ